MMANLPRPVGLSILFICMLLGLLLLSSCGSSGGDEDGGEVVNSIVPQVFVFPGASEKRLISDEKIEQDNCNGSAETSQTVTRQHTVEYTIEVGAGLTVNAEGKVGIPGVGAVGVGGEVATHYNVGYGRQVSVSRSQTVAAAPNSHIQHTIQQFEIWETGEVLIVAGDQNQRLPYSFRRDFSIEVVAPANIGCTPGPATPINSPPAPTAAENKLSVSPSSEICKNHSTGYCGLDVQVSWVAVEPSDGRIYVVGYAPNYGPNNSPLWWIAGTGILPTTSTGSAIITDGLFGNPGDLVNIFACQLQEAYIYSSTITKYEFSTRPDCVLSSDLIELNTR